MGSASRSAPRAPRINRAWLEVWAWRVAGVIHADGSMDFCGAGGVCSSNHWRSRLARNAQPRWGGDKVGVQTSSCHIESVAIESVPMSPADSHPHNTLTHSARDGCDVWVMPAVCDSTDDLHHALLIIN